MTSPIPPKLPHKAVIFENLTIKLLVTSFATSCAALAVIALIPDSQAVLKIALGSIFSTLMAASFISGTFEIYFRIQSISAIKEQMSDALENALEKYNSSSSNGIKHVYEDLDEAIAKIDLYKKIQTAKEIKILVTWLPNLVNFRTHLRKMQQSGGTAQVLCIKENTSISNNRSLYIDSNKETDIFSKEYKEECIKKSVEKIRETKSTIENIFGDTSIRQYDLLPAACLYIVDDTILMCHYLLYRNAFEGMQLEISKNSEYGKQLIEYFDNVWHISQKSLE